MSTLFGPELGGDSERETPTLPEGAHFRPGFLTLEQQRWIVARFHEWIRGPVPLRGAKVRGHEMSVKTVCLGWHWQPYRYTRNATDVNGRPVLPFPSWMTDLGRAAIAAATGDDLLARTYSPDTALVNYYDEHAKMGMHQDRDERTDSPVVSLSIGDSCRFRFGNTEHRNRPYQDLALESGDLFVFGGPSRFAFHGVTKISPGTAPDSCGLKAGRINITMRETGMKD